MTEVQVRHEQDGGVALIRLHAPERKNALVGGMARDLIRAVTEVDGDPRVGAIVISGGTDAFCAGAHRELLAAVASDDPRADDDIEAIYQIFATIRATDAPTIATIAGPAVGAGLNLALACSLRLVGESAYLRSMFLANDIHPAGGHLRLLLDLGGRALAVRMAVLDEPLDAAAAVAAGLTLGPYPDTELEAEAIRLARRAAAKPALARWINRSVGDVANLDDADAARHEADAQRLSLRQR
ncbi:MAG: enoyl-CoA hydratase/isomerase family protein [Solirubrobacteraceae bacterium]